MPERAYPLLLVALVILAHAPALDSGFHYDDRHSLLENPHIRELSQIPRFFSDPTAFSADPTYAMYRPLVLTAHAVNFALGGYAPLSYQLLNLAVHCLATSTVYLLLVQWPLAPIAALAGALLFGLHPLQTEVVNYVSSRSESMAALFYLLSFSGYLRQRQTLSLLSFAAALMCKATAVTLPVALAVHSWVFGDRSLRRLWAYGLLAMGYIFLYTGLSDPGTGIERAAEVRTPLSQIATQAKALVHYAQLVAMPVDLNIQQQFFVSASPLAPVSILCLLALGSLAICARHSSPCSYALFFFVLALAPTLLIPLHVLVNDHRPYLALFGLALALGAACQQFHRTHIALLCLLMASLSLQRGQIWRSELALWRDAARKAPLMPEAHYNHGHALHSTADLDGALSAYKRAIALEPNYARAHSNLGAIYQQRQQLDQAVREYRIALTLEPDAVETLNNIGLCYAGLGQTEQALSFYKRALELDVHQAEVWLNLGLLLRSRGEGQAAARALGRALNLDPTIAERFPAP